MLNNMSDRQQGGEREGEERGGRRDEGRGNPTLDSWKLGELQTPDCLLSHKVKGLRM